VLLAALISLTSGCFFSWPVFESAIEAEGLPGAASNGWGFPVGLLTFVLSGAMLHSFGFSLLFSRLSFRWICMMGAGLFVLGLFSATLGAYYCAPLVPIGVFLITIGGTMLYSV